MLKRACVFVLLFAAGACGGGKSIITSPSNATSPSDPTITFNGLAAIANGSPVSTYSESGFTVSATSGNWTVDTYGNPGPSIIFKSMTGAIQVTAGGATFGFSAVDLYSSLTPIPYTITGLRNSKTIFTMAATLPNTFGAFATVVTPQAADVIDTLTISLTNPLPGNPIGIDNIVLCHTAGACVSPTPTPTAPPTETTTTFTLSGQVTDSTTGIGISGATVSIPGGRNAQSTTTNAAGHYSLTLQQPSNLETTAVFNTSASNYAPQTKTLTFYSNISNPTTGAIQVTAGENLPLSFQLVRANTTISFGGLTGSSFSTYTEFGFTVSATSGNWTVDGYGNPGPSVIFSASAGSTVTGTIQVTAGGAAFSFTSVDLYSSTTPIPYTITGRRNSTTTFTMAATLPNTFGNFLTVLNPQAADLIDTLVISLSNPAAPCCANPMGVDNIAVSK
jgi:hypothetical protein